MPFLIPIFVFLILPGFRVVKQYEQGVIFRFGKIISSREPGLNWMIPYVDKMVKIDFRTITLPVPTQKIITKDNVSVDISAVAYYKVVDAQKSIIAIENVMSAINQIAQTTVRNIVGRFQLDEVLSERDAINKEIRTVLDAHTEAWGVVVSIVEIKDIELPENMQRAMAKQAEAERERRAVIVRAEGEFTAAEKLSQAAKVLSAVPAGISMRTLQTIEKINPDPSKTVIFALPIEFMEGIKSLTDFFGSKNGKK